MSNFAKLNTNNLKMKQIKTLMVAALTLVMGVMMTSCLNSDGGESLWDGYFLAKVVYAGGLYGGATLQDAGGNTYQASATSVAKLEANGFSFTDVEMAFIYYKFSVDENGDKITPPDYNATEPQTFQIELVGIQEAPTEYAERVESAEELETNKYETAPVSMLDFVGSSSNTVKFDFYGNEPMLYMYLQWLLTNGEDEFKKHHIRLVYAFDEITADSNELRFYLCHDKGDDDGKTAYIRSWYCFYIQNALADFERVTGAKPTTIKLSLYEDTSSTGTMPTNRTDYTIDNNND